MSPPAKLSLPSVYQLAGLRYYLQYKSGAKPAYTQTSVSEQQCLQEYASGKQRLVEIGVYMGANTIRFRRVMAADGILMAVDPYYRSLGGILGSGWIRRIAHAEVATCNRGTVLWIERLGKDAVLDPALQNIFPIDFLFIDGDHSWDGIAGDWAAWSDKIKPGGIVALHDSVRSANCGSERFAREVISHDGRFVNLKVVDTLTVLQRTYP